MKVILNQAVPKVGKPDEIVEVKDGYARNFLFPRGMAVVATRSQVQALEKKLARQHQKEEATADSAVKLKEKIDGTTIRIQAKAGQSGKLFGAVTPQDVVDEISKEFGDAIDRRKVAIVEPIRRIGIYPVSIALHKKVDAVVNVDVFDPDYVPADEETTKSEAAAIGAAEVGAMLEPSETEDPMADEPAVEAPTAEESPIDEKALPDPEEA
ncbi:MAG: 50S ribosomal protein L9 [Fimbriimonadaceae bacterium]